MVAAGSPVFKVEWRENKVFIQPTEPNVATNLIVWTASGRFNYELDPAGSVPQMDFAIDQTVADPPAVALSVNRSGKPSDPSPTEVFIEAKPVRLYGPIQEKNRVVVYLTDLTRSTMGKSSSGTPFEITPRKSMCRGSAGVALKTPSYRESLILFPTLS